MWETSENTKTAKNDTRGFLFHGGNKGVLLTHGFSGSLPEVRALADYLNFKGYTVMGVPLAGHGTSPEEMGKTHLNDWIESVRNGLHELQTHCTEIYAGGHSTGGLISLHLSMTEDIRGVIALSPPMLKPSLQWILLPFAPVIRFVMPWYKIGGGSDPSGFRPPYTVVAYPKIPVQCLPDMARAAVMTRNTAHKITVPVFVAQGRKDGIAPLSSAPELYGLLSSKVKKLVWYENSAHVLTVDADREKVVADVEEFIASLASQ